MHAWQGVRRDVVLGALLLTAAGAVWAAEDVLLVTKIRTDTWLYDCDDPTDTTKKTPVRKTDVLVPPWKAIASSSPEYLQVTVDGKSKCVRAYAVETNRPIAVKGECGPKDPGRDARAKFAATRNAGEGCSRK
jgi:hypothetical protein